MQSNSVVLPAPFWPMRPRISPSRSCEVDVVDGGDAAEALHDARGTRARPARPPTPAAVRRTPPSTASVDSGVGRLDVVERRRPAMNTERRMSGRSSSSAVGPVEADLALLHEHGPLGELQGDVDRLLDDDDRRARGVDLAHDLEQLADDRRRQAERQLVDHQQLRAGR